MNEAKQFFTLFGLTHSLSLSFSIDCVVDNRRRNQNNVDNIEQRPRAPNKTNKHSNFFTQNCVLFGLLIINSNMSISNFSNEQRMNEQEIETIIQIRRNLILRSISGYFCSLVFGVDREICSMWNNTARQTSSETFFLYFNVTLVMAIGLAH